MRNSNLIIGGGGARMKKGCHHQLQDFLKTVIRKLPECWTQCNLKEEITKLLCHVNQLYEVILSLRCSPPYHTSQVLSSHLACDSIYLVICRCQTNVILLQKNTYIYVHHKRNSITMQKQALVPI